MLGTENADHFPHSLTKLVHAPYPNSSLCSGGDQPWWRGLTALLASGLKSASSQHPPLSCHRTPGVGSLPAAPAWRVRGREGEGQGRQRESGEGAGGLPSCGHSSRDGWEVGDFDGTAGGWGGHRNFPEGSSKGKQREEGPSKGTGQRGAGGRCLEHRCQQGQSFRPSEMGPVTA